jgi:hypothetical protein
MEKIWIKRTLSIDIETAKLLEKVMEKTDQTASRFFREKIREEAQKLGILEVSNGA